MNTAYWAGEFAKVLLAYVVLMYVWPSVLFRKHLKEKSRTYRFAFALRFPLCSSALVYWD